MFNSYKLALLNTVRFVPYYITGLWQCLYLVKKEIKNVE